MIDLQIQLPPPVAAATGAAVGAVEGGTANRLFRGAADFLLGRFGHSYFHSLVAQVRSDTTVGKSQSCMVFLNCAQCQCNQAGLASYRHLLRADLAQLQSFTRAMFAELAELAAAAQQESVMRA